MKTHNKNCAKQQNAMNDDWIQQQQQWNVY